MHTPRRSRGFTIPEMMIVVAIVGILAAIAAPNMADMVRVQRVRTTAFDIVAGLTLARSEALKRNSTVTITPVNGQWMQGWTTKDANGNVVQEQQAISCGTCTITGPATVAYTSGGRLPIGGTAPEFAVTASNLDVSKFRCIDVDLSGRPVTKQGAC